MRRNEDRDLPILETADADSALPARMNSFGGFGVGGVDDVVLVYRQAARASEVIVFADKLAVLREDLNAMVVAVCNDETALGIELDRMRRPELAGTCSCLAYGS